MYEVDDDLARKLGYASAKVARMYIGTGPGWVVYFVLGEREVVDAPLYMHRGWSSDSGDYTEREGLSAIGEPEAVHPAHLESYAQDAHARRLAGRARGAKGMLADLVERTEAVHAGCDDARARELLRRALRSTRAALRLYD